MQKNKKYLVLRIGIIVLLIALFGLIRIYENQLFYDPFLNYFKLDNNLDLPKVDFFQLAFGLTFRYFLNTIISLAILYLIFLDLELTKFATLLYIVFFVVLLCALYFVLELTQNPNRITLFYIRRFLIQPILLLLFIPAFFFQKQKKLT
jgi:exosortase F-associated protein